MSRRQRKQRAGDWQLCMAFDAETLESSVAPVDLPGDASAVECQPEPELELPPAVDVPVLPAAAQPPFEPLLTDGRGLATDQPPPPTTVETFSDLTRVLIVEPDEPAQTVTTVGMANAKQVFLPEDLRPVIVDRFAADEQIDVDAPAPTLRTESHGHPSGVRTPHIAFVPGVDRPPSLGDRPPYRIPLMREIAEVPWNGLTIVSTFSGCGGSCLGYKMAGYKVAWANEFVPAARETYRANHPGTHLDDRDIRLVTAASIREVIGDVDVDLLEGSPPCASFSTAGKTSKGWGQVRKYSDVEQRTDDLFDQFIRLVDELKPRAFTAENVAGMVKGVAKGFFLEYLSKMSDLPYNVEARLLDAQWLGVPQRRVRLIFVGVRKDVGKPAWPRKLGYRYSIRDAIPWISGGDSVSRRLSYKAGAYDGRMLGHDESAPTVTGDDHCQLYVDEPAVRVVGGNGAIGDAKGREVSLDAPAPTLLAGGEGPHGRRDRDDQFEIRTRVVVGKGAGSLHTHGDDVALDAPAPTIVAGGKEGHHIGPHQFEIQTSRVMVGGSSPSGQRGEAALDEPAPTVIGGNQGGKCQLYVDEPSRDVEPQSALGPAVGTEWDKLAVGGQSDKYLSLIRPLPDAPCPTVTQLGGTSAASVTHPFERRKFTIAELRRICGFPDDFILTGTYSQQWERLGRAVPPPMMRAVAEALVPVLRRDE